MDIIMNKERLQLQIPKNKTIGKNLPQENRSEKQTINRS